MTLVNDRKGEKYGRTDQGGIHLANDGDGKNNWDQPHERRAFRKFKRNWDNEIYIGDWKPPRLGHSCERPAVSCEREGMVRDELGDDV